MQCRPPRHLSFVSCGPRWPADPACSWCCLAHMRWLPRRSSWQCCCEVASRLVELASLATLCFLPLVFMLISILYTWRQPGQPPGCIVCNQNKHVLRIPAAMHSSSEISPRPAKQAGGAATSEDEVGHVQAEGRAHSTKLAPGRLQGKGGGTACIDKYGLALLQLGLHARLHSNREQQSTGMQTGLTKPALPISACTLRWAASHTTNRRQAAASAGGQRLACSEPSTKQKEPSMDPLGSRWCVHDWYTNSGSPAGGAAQGRAGPALVGQQPGPE